MYTCFAIMTRIFRKTVKTVDILCTVLINTANPGVNENSRLKISGFNRLFRIWGSADFTPEPRQYTCRHSVLRRSFCCGKPMIFVASAASRTSLLIFNDQLAAQHTHTALKPVFTRFFRRQLYWHVFVGGQRCLLLEIRKNDLF